MSTDITDGMTATTVQGEDLTFTIKDGSVYVNDAMVVTADIETSNGVIHVIDAVLIPPKYVVLRDESTDQQRGGGAVGAAASFVYASATSSPDRRADWLAPGWFDIARTRVVRTGQTRRTPGPPGRTWRGT